MGKVGGPDPRQSPHERFQVTRQTFQGWLGGDRGSAQFRHYKNFYNFSHKAFLPFSIELTGSWGKSCFKQKELSQIQGLLCISSHFPGCLQLLLSLKVSSPSQLWLIMVRSLQDYVFDTDPLLGIGLKVEHCWGGGDVGHWGWSLLLSFLCFLTDRQCDQSYNTQTTTPSLPGQAGTLHGEAIRKLPWLTLFLAIDLMTGNKKFSDRKLKARMRNTVALLPGSCSQFNIVCSCQHHRLQQTKQNAAQTQSGPHPVPP